MGGLGVFIYDIRSDGIAEEALLGDCFERAEWVPLHGETVSQSYVKWGELYIDLQDFCRV
jgi:hypothetical protein